MAQRRRQLGKRPTVGKQEKFSGLDALKAQIAADGQAGDPSGLTSVIGGDR